MMNAELNKDEGVFLTVSQLAEHPRYPWLTKQVIRHYIFDAEPRLDSVGKEIPGNGLGPAIVRIGRRVLVDLIEFDTWVKAHRVVGNS